MKKLLILLLLSTSFSTFAVNHLDFDKSDFCFQQYNVQDRSGVYYFPNESVGITNTSICVYKYAYGQYESKGALINGKKDGKWTYWKKNGETLEENYYIDGEIGTVACLDPSQNESYLNDETFTGRNICKYENGQILVQGNVIDGKNEGRWTFWHKNGQKGAEAHWKDGKFDGKSTEWYENGQKASEAHWKEGVEDGKFTDWYENGQKSWERTIIDGWFDGKVTEWHENGQVKSEKLYANEKCISGC